MSGDSLKKKQRKLDAQKKFFLKLFGAVYLVDVVLRYFMFWSSVNFYTFMSTGWFTLVNIGCALNIISSIQSAHGDAKTHEHTEDFMYVSIFIQILSIFTAYAKYIYLVVPAYGIYSYCASRSSQPLFPPEQEQDPNAGKKKKSKGKLKYVNRRR